MTELDKKSGRNSLSNVSVLNRIIILLIFISGFACLLLSHSTLFGYHLEGLPELVFDLIGGFLVIAIPTELIRAYFFEEANMALFENRIEVLFDKKVTEANISKFETSVEQLFDRKIDGALLQAKKFGLERIENALPACKLFDELKPGDTLWWLMTFCPGHKIWIDHLEKAVRGGATVNMLIPDPKSPLCAMRADEIGGYYKAERFEVELKTFISDFQECQTTLAQSNCPSGAALNIEFYDDLHGTPCFVVTRGNQPIYAYSSMYLTEPTGVDFPHFYWQQGRVTTSLFAYVKNKYDKFAARSTARSKDPQLLDLHNIRAIDSINLNLSESLQSPHIS